MGGSCGVMKEGEREMRTVAEEAAWEGGVAADLRVRESKRGW